jgi:hypothetical protein
LGYLFFFVFFFLAIYKKRKMSMHMKINPGLFVPMTGNVSQYITNTTPMRYTVLNLPTWTHYVPTSYIAYIDNNCVVADSLGRFRIDPNVIQNSENYRFFGSSCSMIRNPNAVVYIVQFCINSAEYGTEPIAEHRARFYNWINSYGVIYPVGTTDYYRYSSRQVITNEE